jgi:hypothetical protein
MQHIHSSRFLRNLLLGGVFLFPLQLFGADQAAPLTQQKIPEAQQSIPYSQEPLPQVQPPDRFDSMDAPRNYLSDKIANYASSIDRYFGGDRHYQDSNQSAIQLSLAKMAGYGGDPKFAFAANVNIALPKTEGRLRLLLETEPEQNIVPDKYLTTAPTPVDGHTVLRDKVVVPRSAALAVRYSIPEEAIWHFNVDGGLKFPIPVKPFVRARGSYSAPLGEWRMKSAESVYWFNTLGVGSTTLLDFDRVISAPLLFRASSNATWLKDKSNFDLRQDLSVYHTLNDRTALLYQASAIGVTNPKFQVSDYVLLVYCRYRMHEKWLFFELSPQLHFPVANNYKVSPALSMRMEIQFDESR